MVWSHESNHLDLTDEFQEACQVNVWVLFHPTKKKKNAARTSYEFKTISFQLN